MNKRLGFIGIIIEDRINSVERVNSLISEFGSFLLSRTGIPYREKDVSVISLVVDMDSDTLGSFTGKLGAIPSVTVKSALSKK
jgi:putative iron-only hydrogenase system regulator